MARSKKPQIGDYYSDELLDVVYRKPRKKMPKWQQDLEKSESQDWDQWRSNNEPRHGCGHMQGRGAA